MNKMYAMVLFLFVITSTGSVSSNNDDQKISMVVNDYRTTTLKTVVESDIPFQIGRFKLKDGNLLTLLRPVNGATPNCYALGQSCNWQKWCCEGLHCGNGYWCENNPGCIALGGHCNFGSELSEGCCWPNRCSAASDGKCIPRH